MNELDLLIAGLMGVLLLAFFGIVREMYRLALTNPAYYTVGFPPFGGDRMFSSLKEAQAFKEEAEVRYGFRNWQILGWRWGIGRPVQ